MPDTVLQIETDAGVRRLRLDRPSSGNALSADLVDALTDAVEACFRDGVRRLVIEGAGRHFCTGVDLSALDQETDDSLLARFVRIELLLQAVYQAPFETIAIAHGRVAGAGADLFAACRRRVVLGNASFAFPGACGFGLVLGTRRLAARVGSDTAQAWIRSGRWIDAEEALAAGLAQTRIDAAENLDAPSAGLPDAFTQALLDQAMQAPGAADLDLALLARSAARPGLKRRIQEYAARVRAARQQ
ncbi:enoyl-CoA hydratase/isomerase family protein [Pigmentiphaga sp.]|uniref:enoyl-CoA hydratase/isomerase family protein n=1 Tax=Pigmentiphaga sp. TaxID=1977564 RepID=UPI00128C9544|nr:enoyl-CoA hydratase/isomerase family protein [Pigmentiphaga sp.]MPS28703.1 enoyl-CoA hydratase/isomerase family protein [Alcaligenaceae bacterium SAGV5]MPS52486.1 enoyl-CoA hydratase/isomerase family protein [Alcaligenaceae bacterium SAGV3]MPT57674.1 enoyl-CoA hydratase/isomerase family protein [Alcaligenaceae bacterium]